MIAGGSDGAMAGFGTGIARPGQTVITVGTSGTVRKVVGEPWFDPAERTFCYLLTDRLAGPVEPGPIYTPDPRRHEFYKQHHREYRALRRGMAAMGETLKNLKESYA